jgi:hypothetical protein
MLLKTSGFTAVTGCEASQIQQQVGYALDAQQTTLPAPA